MLVIYLITLECICAWLQILQGTLSTLGSQSTMYFSTLLQFFTNFDYLSGNLLAYNFFIFFVIEYALVNIVVYFAMGSTIARLKLHHEKQSIRNWMLLDRRNSPLKLATLSSVNHEHSTYVTWVRWLCMNCYMVMDLYSYCCPISFLCPFGLWLQISTPSLGNPELWGNDRWKFLCLYVFFPIAFFFLVDHSNSARCEIHGLLLSLLTIPFWLATWCFFFNVWACNIQLVPAGTMSVVI